VIRDFNIEKSKAEPFKKKKFIINVILFHDIYESFYKKLINQFSTWK